MARNDITLRITRIPVLAVLLMARKVIACMAGNAHFPAPTIPLKDLERTADELETLVSLSTRGSRQALLERNAKLKTLREMLTAQAWYVRAVSHGEATILGSSGFPMRKRPEPSHGVSAPQGLVASFTGHPGRIDLKWKPVRDARFYRVWVAAGDDPSGACWRELPLQSRTRLQVHGLASCRYHWFKVEAYGVHGFGPESEYARNIAA